MIRFYLVPVETSANGVRGPKYIAHRFDPDPPALVTAAWQAMDYGNEPLMLVAVDATDTDDANLAAQTDVLKFSDNLDDQLGANLTAVQNALESMNLPATLLVATNTYRQVARGITGIFLVAGCMQGKGFNIFSAGITLNTTINSLPVGARNALQNCATTLGFDTTGITGTSTVRQMLRAISTQASPQPMLGVTI